MYWYNDQFYETEEICLPLTDRAFQYGDGLFESIRCEGKRIFFLEDHYTRLCEGAQCLALIPPNSISSLDRFKQTIGHMLHQDIKYKNSARIKIMLWRKPGGLYTPTQSTSNLLLYIQSTDKNTPNKLKLGIFDHIKLPFTPYSRFKTCQSLPYILAGQAASKRQVDDMLLCNDSGFVAECISSNIFWKINDTYYTPSLDCGIVEGIMRKQIIQYLTTNDIPIITGKFGLESLMEAEAVFQSNIGNITPICQIVQKCFTPTLPSVILDLKKSLFS